MGLLQLFGLQLYSIRVLETVKANAVSLMLDIRCPRRTDLLHQRINGTVPRAVVQEMIAARKSFRLFCARNLRGMRPGVFLTGFIPDMFRAMAAANWTFARIEFKVAVQFGPAEMR